MSRLKKFLVACLVVALLALPLPVYATEEFCDDLSTKQPDSTSSAESVEEDESFFFSDLSPEPEVIMESFTDSTEVLSVEAKTTAAVEIVQVGNHQDLQAQLERTNLDKDLVIELTQDIALSANYAAYPANIAERGLLDVKNGTPYSKTITTSTSFDGSATLTRADRNAQSRMLFMGAESQAQGTLILENIIFDGEGDITNVESQTNFAQSPMIYLAGGSNAGDSPKHLIIKDGAVLQNNIRQYQPDAFVNETWTTTGNGSAVFIAKHNTLTMVGGLIQNNFAPKAGAGVYLDSGLASFFMNGGMIRNNKTIRYGAGVYLSDAGGSSESSFTGGTIQGNSTMFPLSGDSDDREYDGLFAGVFSRAPIKLSGSPQILDGISLGAEKTFEELLSIDTLNEDANIILEAGAVSEGADFARQLRTGNLDLLQLGATFVSTSTSSITPEIAAVFAQKNDASIYGTPVESDPSQHSAQWRSSDPVHVSQTEGYIFSEAPAGYNSITPITATITNPNYRAVGPFLLSLSGENEEAFVLLENSIASIAGKGNATFTVSPRIGLAPGTYTTTVLVAEDTGALSHSFRVSFTVGNPKIDPKTLPETGDTNTLIFFYFLALPTFLALIAAYAKRSGTHDINKR